MTNSYGFVLDRDEPLVELDAQARLYRHPASGARLLSVRNDDENKAFGIAFRTPPSDSTGLPHILEHCVLGGSQKYPLKEPFLELVKGSLKTFLNAMTYPDRTLYPVASTNLKDFYNLVDVYLDAVFFPLITPWHLAQEGWHYELENADAPLAIRGVVFNEMKGAYSSPDNLFYRRSLQTLYPDTPYRNDSGGDPAAIPDLSYAAFKAFHERYYHPSNALIYFYGDDEEEERLRMLAGYLERFEARPVESGIPLQPLLSQPRRYTFTYGVDADSETTRKSMLSVNWLLPEGDDTTLVMALSVLSYALIGTQASPLRKALTDSGLGEDVTGGAGAGLRQMSFAAGMKNIAAESVEAVEALIADTIARVARDGFEPEMIEAAVNSIEFSLRENNTGGMPRGLGLLFRALRTWLYDGDPLAPLRYEVPLAAVKEFLAADPDYLPALMRTYLIDNSHRVTVVMHPDTSVNRELEAEERNRISRARAAMNEDDLHAIVANTQELKRRQALTDPPELLATLPSLTLEDLERTNRQLPSAQATVGPATVLHHDLFTNGIVYLTLAWNMHRVPQELLPWVEIFGQTLTQMGTTSEDYVKLSQRIGRKTGGVGASSFLSSVQGERAASAWFTLGGKSTMEQAPEMLAIMRDILLGVRLDNRERLRQIVLKNKSRMEAGLIPGGASVVDGRLRAAFSTASWASEQMDGLDHLFFLRELAHEIENDFPSVLAKLERVRNALVTQESILCNVTLDEANWALFRPHLESLLAQLPNAPAPLHTWTPGRYPAHEGLTLPAQVNYVGKGANLYALGYTYHGSLNVISNLLRTGWLWEKIRVQGGAYGASAGFSRNSGVFTFTSYRDPNLRATLDVYDQSAEYVRTLDLSQTELTRAIIGTISSFDPYLLPDAKGGASMRRYLVGDSEEMLQQFRDEIMGTTVGRIREFAEVLHAAAADARVVILGSADAIAAANDGQSWLTVHKVM